tara:strand:+ start:3967 stop:4416 length:450 start_codon:yes stop_codon:yes gene_type:complete
MNIKFNSKIDSLLKEYNRGVLNMQTQNQHGDTFDPEDDTYTGSTADTDEAIPGEEGEEQKTDRQKDIESLKALRANPDKRHAEKNYGSVEKYKRMLTRKIDKLQHDEDNEEEAEDRCKRKADSVYGGKTSAYKSGAIVRCRKGDIWKKK